MLDDSQGCIIGVLSVPFSAFVCVSLGIEWFSIVGFGAWVVGYFIFLVAWAQICKLFKIGAFKKKKKKPKSF